MVSFAVWRFVLVVTLNPSDRGRSASLSLSNPVITKPAVTLTPDSCVLPVNVPPTAPEVEGICVATWLIVPNR